MRLATSAALLGLILLLAACGGAAPEAASQDVAVAAITVAAEPLQVATVSPTPAPTLTALPTATPTPTRTPIPTLAPTATASPSPTATPAPEALRLTDGGCCTQPFWSADSQEVRFIDRPPGDTRVGIWAVPVSQPLSAPRFLSERVELSLAEGDLLVEARDDTTTIERLSTGERWQVPARGRAVDFSLDRQRIAWSIQNDDLPPDRQVADIWVANVDGSDAVKVASLRRGGLQGWIGNDALLVSGRESAASREQTLWALAVEDGARVELARAERLRSPVLSPSGAWAAYYVTFDPNPERNGLFLVRTDGSEVRRLPDELFGSYQWRGCPGGCGPEDDRLLVIPFEPDAVWHELWEVEPATGAAHPLTDPEVTPFKIANGDWRVSPDGRRIAFVESSDRNIWIITLPE